MKRLFFCAGMALWLLSSCGNNNSSPDTSGATPGRNLDQTGGTNSGSPNMNNDGTNNNGTVSTADSNFNKNRDSAR